MVAAIGSDCERDLVGAVRTFDPNSQFDSLGELGRTINRAAAGVGGGMRRRQLAYDGNGSGIRRR